MVDDTASQGEWETPEGTPCPSDNDRYLDLEVSILIILVIFNIWTVFAYYKCLCYDNKISYFFCEKKKKKKLFLFLIVLVHIFINM